MLRMPPFDLVMPDTVQGAVNAKAQSGESLFVAGGTDLLPNLKHQLHSPKLLVDLSRVEGLSGIDDDGQGGLRIGAMTRLHDVVHHPLVGARAPALALAASLIAGPQHRRMGTLGGNVLLDTRCLFYNQTEAWRAAIGFCLKRDGTHCHVSGSPKGCVAAQSSDTVPVLTALGASIEATLPDLATVRVPLEQLFGKDGRYDQMFQLPPGSLLTAVVVPAPAHRQVSTYRKVRSRAAVDFPQVGVAVSLQHVGSGVSDLVIVLGAMLPAPRRIEFPDVNNLDDAAVDAVVARVLKQCRPMTSVHGDIAWRRHMAGVETRRALLQLRSA